MICPKCHDEYLANFKTCRDCNTKLVNASLIDIPIPEIRPFITVILILLWVAAASALILLPAIFVTLEKMGIGAVGGANGMARRLGLVEDMTHHIDDGMDASLVDDVIDVW